MKIINRKELFRKAAAWSALSRRITLLFMLLVGLLAGPALPERAEHSSPVVVLEVKGIISGAVKNYVTRGIKLAGEQGAPCVVITIDTPGGLMDSMKDIATEMINADIPVVVYVYPNGSTATSAGFFILMAGDFAAMAPNTTTGSASPVTMGGGKVDKTMKNKMFGYAEAYMDQLIRRRGRNIEYTRLTVTEGKSIDSKKALAQNVIEIIAADMEDLLDQLDGREFVKGRQEVYVIYLDSISDELREDLDKRGLLETPEKSGESVIDPDELNSELLKELKEKGYEENEDGEILVNREELDEDLLKRLEDEGLIYVPRRDNEVEIDADLLDDELKAKLQGRNEVRDEGTTFVLRTKGADYETLTWSLREKFFQIIGHPNIAYILMMVGVYAIIFEVTHPGAIFPGVIGAVCLLIAFTSFQVIPINSLGLILIIAAFVLFILEVKIVSHGLLTIGGIVAMTAGSLLLVDSTDPAMRVSIPLIITIVCFTALLFLVIIAAVIRTHKKPVITGAQGMIGKSGRALSAMAPDGKVFVNGEIWSARSDGGVLEKDAKITVAAIEGTVLIVKGN